MKKILLTVIMLLVLTCSSYINETSASSFDSQGFFTSLRLSKIGGSIETPLSNDDILGISDKIKIAVDFAIPDGISIAGAESTFTLPNPLDTVDVASTSIPIYYNNDPSKLLATVTFDNAGNGKFKLTSDQDILNQLNKTGNFYFTVSINSSLITEEKTYPFDFGNLGTVSPIIVPGSNAPLNEIWKGGTEVNEYNGIKLSEGKFISWVVYISSENSLTDVTLTDVLGPGQKYVSDSFSYVEIDDNGVLLDGNAKKIESNNIGPGKMLDISNNTFTLSAGALKHPNPGNGIRKDIYRLNYLVEKTDNLSHYTNKVTATGNSNELITLEKESTVISSGSGSTGESRKVQLQKIDSVTKEKITGAMFDLYKYNYTTEKWEVFSKNISIDNINGSLVTNLTFGNYHFVETKAPDNYLLKETPFSDFMIDSNTPTENFVFQYENTKVINETGNIELKKIDSDTSSALANAQFKLQKSNGELVSENHLTDKYGKLNITGLAIGDYEFIETKAPTGYILDSTPLKFTVSIQNNSTVYLTMKNTKIKEPINKTGKSDDNVDEQNNIKTSLPITGDNAVTLIIISIIACSCLIYIKKGIKID